MKYLAAINIMPHKVLLDPQGKAVTSGLKNLGLNTVADVRVGKHITLEIDAPTSEEAQKITEEACKKLLANQVMEYFEFTISEFA
jgi:phosphoribosylformylglycinamidine synthase